MPVHLDVFLTEDLTTNDANVYESGIGSLQKFSEYLIFIYIDQI